MAGRSYFERVLGGHDPVALSPPRLLFRPAVLPAAVTRDLEMTAKPRPSAETRFKLPAVGPGPASVSAGVQPAPDRHPAVGLGAPRVASGVRKSVPDEGRAAATNPTHAAPTQLTGGAPLHPESPSAFPVFADQPAPAAPVGPPFPLERDHPAARVRSATSGPTVDDDSETENRATASVALPWAGTSVSTAPRTLTVGPMSVEPQAPPPAPLQPVMAPTAPRTTAGPVPAEPHEVVPPLRPVGAAPSESTSTWRPAADTTGVSAGRDTAAVDRPRGISPTEAPIRLEPPAFAPRPLARSTGERSGGVRIGSLEVRIVKPDPRPVQATHFAPPSRPVPQTAAAVRLARGFRSFGLAQE